MEFSLAAGVLGLVGVVWLEAMRFSHRRSRGLDAFLGMGSLRYLCLPFLFGCIAFVVAGVSGADALGSIAIGFGVPSGPVAAGIISEGGPPRPKGASDVPRIEEIPTPTDRSRGRAGWGTYFKRP